MNIPTELKYSKSDEWVKVEGKSATIGITDFAQDQLSDVVFVDILAKVNGDAKIGTICATLESVKAAADVSFPISGKVTKINETLSDTPETVNKDPYGVAWMIKIDLNNPSELDSLMDAKTYEAYCEERNH